MLPAIHDAEHPADAITNALHRLAASSAAAVLVVLSWFNAVHSPMFDCIRASAYVARSRRETSAPMRAVNPSALHLDTPRSSQRYVLTPKEDFHVRP